MTHAIRVAIIEDQRLLRDALASLFDRTAGYKTAGSYGSMEDALPALSRDVPDVVLADIGLPGMSGIDGVRLIKTQLPGVQIVMLTVFEDNEHVFQAICAGASGYLLKDTPKRKLLDAIRELHDGGAPMSPDIARKVVKMFRETGPKTEQASPLSDRELDVLRLLADGHVYKTAADALSLSIDTVRFHVRHIYDKLHVHSKSEAVLKAFREGILR